MNIQDVFSFVLRHLLESRLGDDRQFVTVLERSFLHITLTPFLYLTYLNFSCAPHEQIEAPRDSFLRFLENPQQCHLRNRQIETSTTYSFLRSKQRLPLPCFLENPQQFDPRRRQIISYNRSFSKK